MVDSKENHKFDVGVKGLTIYCDSRKLSTPDLCDLIEEFFGYSVRNTKFKG